MQEEVNSELTMLEHDKSGLHEILANSSPLLSVVTTAYNEAGNLPLLYEQLSTLIDPLGIDWEWIVIDDHSSDGTFAVIADIASRDSRVHAIRLARNFGSHMATTCGLFHAKGDCTAIMAAHLPDPPEARPARLNKRRRGAHHAAAAAPPPRGR